MFWKLGFTPKAEKEFKKLDAFVQRQIKEYFYERVLKAPNPLVFAKHLKHNLSDFYRFRIENHRVLCSVEKMHLVITVVKVSHRKDVYKL